MFIEYAIERAENIVEALFWPLFLFEFFRGNYVVIGINAAVVVAVALLLSPGFIW